MLDRLKRLLPKTGDWTPLIPLRIRAVILIVWAIEPIARGIDYLTGDGPGVTQSLTEVEAAFPLPMWGLFCLSGGSMILIGFAGRWRRVSIIGLHITGATYFALAVGLAAVAAGRDWDGFRTPMMFFVFAITFWAAAIGYATERRDQLVVLDDDPETKVNDRGTPDPDDG